MKFKNVFALSGPMLGGKKFIVFILAIILTFGLSISLQSLLADWTAPKATPPTCKSGDFGCDEPLNVGASPQIKAGALWLNTNAVSPWGLLVQNGKVGIGTTSPTTKLSIQSDDSTVGNMGFGGSYLDMWFDGGSDSDFFFVNTGDSSNGSTQFRNSSSNSLLYIKNNGNIVIGTVEPAAKLDVNGKVLVNGGSIIRTTNTTQQKMQMFTVSVPAKNFGASGASAEQKIVLNWVSLGGTNFSTGGKVVAFLGNYITAGGADPSGECSVIHEISVVNETGANLWITNPTGTTQNVGAYNVTVIVIGPE